MALDVVDEDEVEGDGSVDAVVAHGLIGSLAVATGAASMLLKGSKRFDATTEQWLVDSITEQTIIVVEGMKHILDNATETFFDAATNVSMAAGSLPGLNDEQREPILQALLRASDVLQQILGGLVRGLAPEVIELLDELSSSHSLDISPPATRG